MTSRSSVYGFVGSLVVPSTAVVERFLGLTGALIYCVVAAVVLFEVHRRFADTLVAAISPQSTGRLAAALAAVLVIAFLVGYPIAQSGMFGSGSDRDDHLMMAATELLHGRYPYYVVGPLGLTVSQLPGAILLAAPFALMGNAAYQNLFWLAIFAATLGRLARDLRPVLVLLIVLLALAPVVLREYLTGGDLLANSLYVLLFTVWMVHVTPRDDSRRWEKALIAIGFGIGLSSRTHFLLVLPLVFSVLARRTDWRTAVAYLGLTCATSTLVTAPFYLYDPPRFTPLSTADFLRPEFVRPAGTALMLASFVAVAIVTALYRSTRDMATLMRRCAVVLAVPIVATTLLQSFGDRTLQLYYIHYGLSFVFFGALGFLPRAIDAKA